VGGTAGFGPAALLLANTCDRAELIEISR
jgi:hypothetical protein